MRAYVFVIMLISVFIIACASNNTPNELGSVCGNLKCEPGENPGNCHIDCCTLLDGTPGFCGDGKCLGFGCGEDPATCPEDCGNICGNGTCEKGENPENCAADCQWQKCGDGVCTPDDGGPEQCPEDCGSKVKSPAEGR